MLVDIVAKGGSFLLNRIRWSSRFSVFSEGTLKRELQQTRFAWERGRSAGQDETQPTDLRRLIVSGQRRLLGDVVHFSFVCNVDNPQDACGHGQCN